MGQLKKIFFLIFIFFASDVHPCALCGTGGASYVNVSTNTVFRDSSIQKISVLWKFDDFLSAQILSIYDKNKNGKFDPKEIQDIFTVLSKLEKPSFMTVVNISDKEFKGFSIQNFNAYAKEKNIFFSFDIALGYRIVDKAALSFYFVDTTQYLHFFHTAENIKFSNSAGFKINKNFELKVLPGSMSIVNIITYEVKK